MTKLLDYHSVDDLKSVQSQGPSMEANRRHNHGKTANGEQKPALAIRSCIGIWLPPKRGLSALRRQRHDAPLTAGKALTAAPR